MKTGKVWLVGAGPGDIGLFTLKGLKVLEQADVVVYDSLVGQGVLSRIPENDRLINVGKRASHHAGVGIDREQPVDQAQTCMVWNLPCGSKPVSVPPSSPRSPHVCRSHSCLSAD